jgi:hypothetical protein
MRKVFNVIDRGLDFMRPELPEDESGLQEEQIVSPEDQVEQAQDQYPVRGKPLMKPQSRQGNVLFENPPAQSSHQELHHFVNGLDQTVLYLPNSFPGSIFKIQDCWQRYGSEQSSEKCILVNYLKGFPFWRGDYSGQWPVAVFGPLLFALFLISVGLWAVWKKRGLMIFLPIFALLAQILIYSLIHRTGGRYVRPVDWLSLMFYGVGLMEVTFSVYSWIQGKNGFVRVKKRRGELDNAGYSDLIMGSIAVGLFALAVIIPASEVLIPQRFTPKGCEKRYQVLFQEGLLEKNKVSGHRAICGRALYPRYFSEGQAVLDNREMPKNVSFSRVDFFLAGTESTWVTLPQMSSPETFPHGVDVLALGKEEDKNVFQADIVVIYDQLHPGQINRILRVER